jgi:serine/threonine protein kinase
LNGKDFSSKCDVWSLGVVFYEMLSGRTPWTGKDLPDLRNNINHKQI